MREGVCLLYSEQNRIKMSEWVCNNHTNSERDIEMRKGACLLYSEQNRIKMSEWVYKRMRETLVYHSVHGLNE